MKIKGVALLVVIKEKKQVGFYVFKTADGFTVPFFNQLFIQTDFAAFELNGKQVGPEDVDVFVDSQENNPFFMRVWGKIEISGLVNGEKSGLVPDQKLAPFCFCIDADKIALLETKPSIGPNNAK